MKKTNAEELLAAIHFDDRLEKGEWFSNKEMAEILGQQLSEHKKGYVSNEFIKDLAYAFYQEAMIAVDYDENLTGVLCDLSSAKEQEIASLVNKSLDRLNKHEKSENKGI